MLVKHWSNTDQTLAKHWSNTARAPDLDDLDPVLLAEAAAAPRATGPSGRSSTSI
jgi:hypothetical protein